MMRLILACIMLCVFTQGKAQKLKIDQLEQLLDASIDGAEESLFLQGYSFLSKRDLQDSAGVIYSFSNRKKTIGTAKLVRKGAYYKEPLNSYMEYITYDRNEFEAFRKLMIDNQFIREDLSISENSVYRKDNLKVNFRVSTDEYENLIYEVKICRLKAMIEEKAAKKLNLKNIFKQ